MQYEVGGNVLFFYKINNYYLCMIVVFGIVKDIG